MKKRLFSLILALLLLSGLISPEVYAENSENTTSTSKENILSGSDYIDGTVIVTVASPGKTSLTREGTVPFDKDISVEETYNFGNASSLAGTEEQEEFLSDMTLYISEVSSDTYSTGELIEKLENKAYVVCVEPDYEQSLSSITDDTYSDEQWYLDKGGTFSGTSSGISFSSAKSKIKSSTPVVAVMDTGINIAHEDLADRMWVNTNTSLWGIYGYDFVNMVPDCTDTIGHGTHCAGVIAASADNQKGISGISGAKLMALKVFNSEGKTSNSIVISALNYIQQAKNAGVNVVAVNCSWGGGTSGQTMATLINKLGQMGTLFVFASGNDAVNHDATPPTTCPYDLYNGIFPSSNRNYIIITGASDPYDRPATFSDYGKTDVDLFAPGERIFSTYIEDTYMPGTYEKEKEEILTEHFFSFDSEEDKDLIYTDLLLGITSNAPSDVSFDPSADYREDSSSGSLKWTIDLGSISSAPRSAYLYLDVTEQNPDLSATYYVSMILRTKDSDGISSWQHVVKKSSGEPGTSSNRFYTAPDGRIYFKIIGLESSGHASGTTVFHVDDIGISKADPDTSLFGQYEWMNGTSMAAPMVTGAVALLSEIYPSDDAVNRRNRLLTCVRTTPEATGKCITNGVLDLSKMDQYTVSQSQPENNVDPSSNSSSGSGSQTVSGRVSVKKVTISQSAKKTYTKTVKKGGKKKKVKKTATVKLKKSKITLQAGNKLQLKASVQPAKASTKKVKWSSSKKKWAAVTQKGLVTAKKKGRGHTVKITASATDGSGKKAVCRIKIRK